MKPPPIPPDRAFAVDGIVDARVRATLAEARRIRDGWAEALAAARREADAAAEARLVDTLGALTTLQRQLAVESREAARRLAIRLAERLLGATLEADPARVEAWLDALITAAPAPWIVIHVPIGLASAALPGELEIRVDPTLAPGELILEGPAGIVDARFAPRLARALAGAP